MKNLLTNISTHASHVAKHVSKNKHRYALGFVGSLLSTFALLVGLTFIVQQQTHAGAMYDGTGDFSVSGALLNSQLNQTNIYGGDVMAIQGIMNYAGENISQGKIYFGVPIGFELTTLPFADNTSFTGGDIVYGGPGDGCYADFVKGTGAYIPHFNTLINNFLSEHLTLTGDKKGNPMYILTLSGGDQLPLMNHTGQIASTSGLTQWTRVLVDVLQVMGEGETSVSLEDALNAGTNPATLIAQLCMGKTSNLNECEPFGKVLGGDLGLDTIPNCGAKVYTTPTSSEVGNQKSNNEVIIGKHPYVAGGIDINLFVVSDYQDTDISNNMGKLHVDMTPGIGASCFDASTNTTILHDTFTPLYMGTGTYCKQVIKVCMEGTLFAGGGDGGFSPFDTTASYYTSPLCMAEGPSANVKVIGSSRIGSQLVGSYSYVSYMWKEVGTPFNGIYNDLKYDSDKTPYIIYNNNGGSTSILKFNGTEWIQFGNVLSNGNIDNIIFDHANTPYLLFNNYSNNSRGILKFQDNTWIPFGNEFPNQGPSLNNLSFDSQNNLYYTVNGNILYKISSIDSTITQMDVSSVSGTYIQSINTIFIGDDDTLYLHFYGYNGNINGYFVYAFTDGTWTDVASKLGLQPFDVIIQVYTDNTGTHYAYISNGNDMKYRIMKLQGSNFKQVGDTFYIYNGNIQDVFFDSTNTLYIRWYNSFNGSNSILKFDSNSNQWTQIGSTFSSTISLGRMFFDNNDNVYLMTMDNNDKSTHIYILQNNIWTQLGDAFNGSSTKSIIFDGNNVPYIVTYVGGVNDASIGSGIAVNSLVQPTNKAIGGIYTVYAYTPDAGWTPRGNSFSYGEIREGFISNGIFHVLYTSYADKGAIQSASTDTSSAIITLKLAQGAAEGHSHMQRFRNNTAITGAIGTGYTLTFQDANSKIKLGVQPTDIKGVERAYHYSPEVKVQKVPVVTGLDIVGALDIGSNLLATYTSSWTKVNSTTGSLVGENIYVTTTDDGSAYLSLIDSGSIYIKKYIDSQRTNISPALEYDGSGYTLETMSDNKIGILENTKLFTLKETSRGGMWITSLPDIQQTRNKGNGIYLLAGNKNTGNKFRRLTNGTLTDLSAPNISCSLSGLLQANQVVDGVELLVSYDCTNDTKVWSLTDSGVWIQVAGSETFDSDSSISVKSTKKDNLLNSLLAGGTASYTKAPIITIISPTGKESYRYFVDTTWIRLPAEPTVILWKNDRAYFNFYQEVDLGTKSTSVSPTQEVGKFALYTVTGGKLTLQTQYNNFVLDNADISTNMFSDKNGNFYIETLQDLSDYPGNDNNKLFKFVSGWQEIMNFSSLLTRVDVASTKVASSTIDNKQIIELVPGIDGIQLDENNLPLVGYIEYGLADGPNGINTAIADIYKWSDGHFVRWFNMIDANTNIDGVINDVKQLNDEGIDFVNSDFTTIIDQILANDTIKTIIEHILTGDKVGVNIALAPYIINISLSNGIATYNGDFTTKVSFSGPLTLENGVSLNMHSDLPFALSYQNGHLKMRRFNNNKREVFGQETMAIEKIEGIRAKTQLFENDALVITQNIEEGVVIKGYKNNTRSTLVNLGKGLPSVNTLMDMLNDWSTLRSGGVDVMPIAGWTYDGSIYAMINNYSVASFGKGIRTSFTTWINRVATKVASKNVSPKSEETKDSLLGLRMDSNKTLNFVRRIEVPAAIKLIPTITDTFQNGNEVYTLYQWQRNGKAIPGATNKEYTPTQADAGQKISFTVTPQIAGGFIGTPLTSSEKTINGTNPGTNNGGSAGGAGGGNGGGSTTGTIITSGSTSTHASAGTIDDPKATPEFVQAYQRALANGITTMDTYTKAGMNLPSPRAHIAKMMVKYVTEILKKIPDTTKSCSFTDTENQSSELQGYITEACQLGLMGQGINAFRPGDYLTRAEFVTLLARALYGDTYNTSAPYYAKSMAKLFADGVIKNTSPSLKEIKAYLLIMLERTATGK